MFYQQYSLFAMVRTVVSIALVLLAAVYGAEAQNNPVKLVKGVITVHGSDTPTSGGMVTVYRVGSDKVANTSKISRSGEYQVILDPETEYRFVVDSPYFYNDEFTLTTPPESTYEETIRHFSVRPIELGRVLYSGRLFAPGSSELKVTAAFGSALDSLAEKRSIVFTIGVTADASEQLDAAAAKALARERARAIREAIKERGISLTRIRWDLPEAPTATTAANASLTITAIDDEDDA